jgi:hypothetical protein
MTTTIEHVRHRVLDRAVPGTILSQTVCGRRFIGIRESTRDTRHHEPATSRCAECWR